MTDGNEPKRAAATAFGEAAASYLDSEGHREGADLDLLAAWCAGADRALDVATGAGHTAGALGRRGVPVVVGTDVAPEMVATAVEAFGIAGVVADAEELPFRDDAFDAVTCRIAAHHFPDPAAFLEEAFRVLEPGGTVAFEDNAAPDDPDLAAFFDRVERLRDPTHETAYTVEGWRDLIEAAGFSIEEVATTWKDLDYRAWLERTDTPADRREELADLVWDPAAGETHGVRLEDGEVVAFGNRKVLIRAMR